MNILLIEDEAAAAKRLREMVLRAEPGAHIIATLESVATATQWLKTNPGPDLIISDVQLADGICFDIFKQVTVTAPIIFTTAYDEYTLKAFKLNSIDYLLKPIDMEELCFAFSKYHSLKQAGPSTANDKIFELLQQLSGKAYRTRFLIKQADKLLTVPEGRVSWLQADGNIIYLCTNTGERHIIDEPLDELEQTLQPASFFRLNRRYIARIDSIENIYNHFNGRLKIDLKYSRDKEIFVSREKASLFKSWLDS